MPLNHRYTTLGTQVASKAGFFHLDEFHGIDLTSLCEDAALEYFRQPCVEQINPACLVGEPVSKVRPVRNGLCYGDSVGAAFVQC